ncbi:DUF1835 domain-containing protein [Pseudomonas sp. S9]|uniref:DUF1835 domain-containing protein n=1 Tax=Pseudomonas sp. S9 TaxID=686578 RepID=UPI00030BB79D|nr:DUF1835 domain-containing protein [Pseudomonas sp. S9]
MWHLVCGDNAVAGVTHCIGAETARQSLRVMRDDLAVGPLADIDTPPCQMRSDFWQQLLPASVQLQPDFGSGLSSDALWLKARAHQHFFRSTHTAPDLHRLRLARPVF